MKKELQVQPQEFGLTEEKGMQIMQSFNEKLVELEGVSLVYATLVAKEINDETVKEAKTVAKTLKDVRLSTNKIHKVEKEFYLQGGRFVDALKNKIVYRIEEMEANVNKIVKHKEIAEKAIQDALLSERTAICEKYEIDTIGLNLGTMQKEVWDSFIKVKKEEYEEKQELIRLDAERDKTKLHILSLSLVELLEYDLKDELLKDVFNYRLMELTKQYNRDQWSKESVEEVDFSHMLDEEADLLRLRFKQNAIDSEINNIRSMTIEQLRNYNVIYKDQDKLRLELYKEKCKAHYNAQLLKPNFDQVDTTYLTEEQIKELERHFDAKLYSEYEKVILNINNTFNKNEVFHRDDYINCNFGKYQTEFLNQLNFFENKQQEINKEFERLTSLLYKPFASSTDSNKCCDMNGNFCFNFNDITPALVEQFNTHQKNIELEQQKKLGDNEQLKIWIDSFSINQAPINNQTSQEIINKFNAFKQWAIKQVK